MTKPLAASAREIASGFDYQSFVQSERLDALENPLFSHLPRTRSKDLADTSKKISETIETSLANASSREEAESIISKAIAKKIRTLVAQNEDDIDMNRSVGDLGMDSLVIVELKNWIAQTFQARFQTSEILKSPNIVSLASALANRSPMVASKTASSTVCMQNESCNQSSLLVCLSWESMNAR